MAPAKYILSPGQKFGMLTVLQKVKIGYLCRCDCGKEIQVNGYALAKGITVSCGCRQRGEYLADQLIGKHIGTLTVLAREKVWGDGKIWGYRCRCDCGRELYTKSVPLLRGNVTCKMCSSLKNMKICQETLGNGAVEETNLYRLMNKAAHKNSITGERNIYWHAGNHNYYVSIVVNKKAHYIGSTKDLEKAKRMRDLALAEFVDPVLERNETVVDQIKAKKKRSR